MTRYEERRLAEKRRLADKRENGWLAKVKAATNNDQPWVIILFGACMLFLFLGWANKRANQEMRQFEVVPIVWRTRLPEYSQEGNFAVDRLKQGRPQWGDRHLYQYAEPNRWIGYGDPPVLNQDLGK